MQRNVRLAELSDIEELLSVIYQLSPKKEEDEKVPKSALKDTLKVMLKNKDYRVAVYEYAGKIVGSATLLIQLNHSHGGRPYAHIENVVTDSNHRGIGVGKDLVNYLVSEAKKIKCYKIILNCSQDNIPFYEKCDFVKTGEVEMRLDL